MARNLTIVHSLALASLMVLFLGALGLSQRLKSADRFDKIGLVLFAFASIAVMNVRSDGRLSRPQCHAPHRRSRCQRRRRHWRKLARRLSLQF